MAIRSPIILAADQLEEPPYVTESEVINTLRMLVDSMDFSEEDGDGWEVLKGLSCASNGGVTSKVLLWILRLLSFELKTNIVERHFAYMLSWTIPYGSSPEEVEATDLLLNLGGHGMINALPGTTDGYVVLHEVILKCWWGDRVSAVVARGPDLHRRCFDTSYTPFEESPTSIAMYSARTFSHWLRALAGVDVDLEKFIDQELELNPEVHTGWEKETLLELFAAGDRPDLHPALPTLCNDCLKMGSRVEVQPYWRHLLERIKERKPPYGPVAAVSEVDEDESHDLGSLGEAASFSTDLDPALGDSENVPLPNPDLDSTESEVKLEADGSENSARTQSGSVCLYGKLERVCIACWLYYERTGTRKQPARNETLSKDEDSSPREDSSECEYSPYLIHS